MILLLAAVTFPAAPQTSGLTDVLMKHVYILASDSLSGRGFGFPEKHLAISYITRQYEDAGFAKAYDTSYIHHFESNILNLYAIIGGKNIIGIIEGSDPLLKNEYVLLGAHYDHLGWKSVNGQKVIYNGADDNASGVAVIIETGKELVKQRGSLGRSVIIAAFDGEEAGLLGSSAYARSEIPSRFNVKIMFSLDMVGMLEKNGGLDLAGLNALKGGEHLSSEVISNHGLNIKKTYNRIEYRTDTWPFALKGIPAIYLSTGLVSPYHKPEDDAHLLDYKGMSQIVSMMTDLTLKLSGMDSIEARTGYITHKTDPMITAGFRFGYGSSFHFYKNTFYKAKQVSAFEAGPEIHLRLTRKIWLQPALIYQYAGSHTEAGKLKTHSLIPQADMLLTVVRDGFAQTNGYFIAGGYYDYIIAGREAGTAADLTAKYLDSGYGLRLGAGISVLNFRTAIILKYGLNSVIRDETIGKVYNRSIMFSTTFCF